jgi:predicted metal-dependent hydrolase
VSVRELGFHWASCGKAGALSVHWKLLMAPATVIDYVVVHELCHCATAITQGVLERSR